MARTPVDPDFETRVRSSFARQRLMDHIGAVLERVSAGEIEITLPYRAELTQQHGFLHAGIVATILDSACGYAAFTLMAPDMAVLTAEYKINLLRPAQGERFVAKARVVKAGRTLTVCSADAYACVGDDEKTIATMLATILGSPQREGLRQ